MGDDYEKKLEKKRQKAEYKLEKKRLKRELEIKDERVQRKEGDTGNGLENAKADSREPKILKISKDSDNSKYTANLGRRTPGPEKNDEKTVRLVLPKEKPKPWYKDPNWIRAIASIVVMIIAILTFYFTYYH